MTGQFYLSRIAVIALHERAGTVVATSVFKLESHRPRCITVGGTKMRAGSQPPYRSGCREKHSANRVVKGVARTRFRSLHLLWPSSRIPSRNPIGSQNSVLRNSALSVRLDSRSEERR